jgi:hypothetical protein
LMPRFPALWSAVSGHVKSFLEVIADTALRHSQDGPTNGIGDKDAKLRSDNTDSVPSIVQAFWKSAVEPVLADIKARTLVFTPVVPWNCRDAESVLNDKATVDMIESAMLLSRAMAVHIEALWEKCVHAASQAGPRQHSEGADESSPWSRSSRCSMSRRWTRPRGSPTRRSPS